MNLTDLLQSIGVTINATWAESKEIWYRDPRSAKKPDSASIITSLMQDSRSGIGVLTWSKIGIAYSRNV